MKKLMFTIKVLQALTLLTFFHPQDSMSQTPAQNLSQEEVKRVSENADLFKSISKVNELPGGLSKHFKDMADPGKPFNSGCVRTPGLPGEAMIFAAASNDRLWFSYQSGGFCLVNRLELYELSGSKSKLLWSTVTPRPMASTKEIGEFLKKTKSNTK